jgi:putative acetyltransferase
MDTGSMITIPSEKDFDEITALWERSVRATHHFLKEEDIRYFRPLVRNQYLGMVKLYCIRDEDRIKGFLGLSDDKIEMLFIDPELRGKGIGGKLLKFAIHELGYSQVDVNEQNTEALAFYKRYGFEVVGRTEKDATGRDYPILNLALNS